MGEAHRDMCYPDCLIGVKPVPLCSEGSVCVINSWGLASVCQSKPALFLVPERVAAAYVYHGSRLMYIMGKCIVVP